MHVARIGTAFDSCNAAAFRHPRERLLLVEVKAVEILHPSSKAQLFSYMKLLDVPIGLLINFHEPVLKNGISRMILPGANRGEGNEGGDVSL